MEGQPFETGHSLEAGVLGTGSEELSSNGEGSAAEVALFQDTACKLTRRPLSVFCCSTTRERR